MALNRWLRHLVRVQGKGGHRGRLEAATTAALRIQTIELRHFQGDLARFDQQLDGSSGRLAMVARQFRQAMAVCKRELPELQACRGTLTPEQLQQLQLVEEVVGAYHQRGPGNVSRDSGLSQAPEMVPRSLLGLFSRIRDRLAPGGEAATVEGFRRRRDSALVSLRILLLLVLVPLLFQQFSRTLLVGPVVDRIAPVVPVIMYTRGRLEERAVEKLRIYKEELEFEALLRGKRCRPLRTCNPACGRGPTNFRRKTSGRAPRPSRICLRMDLACWALPWSACSAGKSCGCCAAFLTRLFMA